MLQPHFRATLIEETFGTETIITSPDLQSLAKITPGSPPLFDFLYALVNMHHPARDGT